MHQKSIEAQPLLNEVRAQKAAKDDLVSQAVAIERERCASIADNRALEDRKRWQNELDWRQPYAFNRVIRASLDIAAAIRRTDDQR